MRGSKKKPKIAYGNSVNLSGLYSSHSVKLTYNPELDSWWDKSGNYNADFLGLEVRDGIVVFSSVNKRDVDLWTMGAKAVMDKLRRWSET